jgi:polar amino acid transport system substrate-binding protein
MRLPASLPAFFFCCTLMQAVAQSQPLPQAAPQAAPIEVRVGLGLSKPPYIMESGDSGMEYEIAEKALAAGGCKMIPLQFPPARALAMLRAGQIDAMLTVDEGIGGNDHFSEPYLVYHNVATTLASRRIELRSIEDLQSYSVGAFQNANVILGPRFKAFAATHADYKEYPQQILQDKMLFTGRVDVVVGDQLIFRYFSSRLEPGIDGRQPVVFHHIFPPSPRKAVFRDAALRDRFNEGLRTIRRNGMYDAIVRKYLAMVMP